ncbi:hypothetical protein DFH11DRAFT_1877855 [Phellopilus nigrolimitatus]|nr:hypothetical protein DFH11DRAFT_1877855 [Phellopilus nigrolimitatus]
MASPATQPSCKTSLLSFPDEILLKIFSEFSFPNQATDDYERVRLPWNSFLVDRHRRDKANSSDIHTRHSLARVSRLFHALMKELLYGFVCIRNIRNLCALRNALANSSALAGNLARHTRRMDIMLIDEPESSSDWHTRNPDARPKAELSSRSRVTSFYTVAEAILRHCSSLTHLGVCMLFEPTDEKGHLFGSTLTALCPSLQVLNWRFASKIRLAPLLRNLAGELRVLEVSNVAIFCDATEIGVAEMPHLHTLKGAIDILLPALNGVRLPSLTTFIAELHTSKGYSDSNLAELADEFFEKYGHQINTYVSCTNKILVDLTTMPNLRELAFHALDKRILSTQRSAMLDLARIGILRIQAQENLDSNIVRICEEILDDYDTAFPALKTVQLLDMAHSTNLRRGWSICGAVEDRFQAAGIEFLDYRGNSIESICLEHTYKSSGATESNTEESPYIF